MKSKTYYGEYSLMHWVNMLLSGDIELPDYQRSFVWQEKDIKRLLKSFSERQFVQPVTIALYPETADNHLKRNLVLDGQQRLTTILLAYIGYMPILSNFAKDDTLATEDDSASDDDTEPSKAIKWTFKEVLAKGATYSQIRSQLAADPNYLPIEVDGLHIEGDREPVIIEFLKDRFLGFSYIVPETTDTNDIQNGYTRLFRNINFFGKRLTTLASRRSLYYTNRNYKRYFEGLTADKKSVLNGITIKEKMEYNTIDFVRYLSVLSQYYVNKRTDSILKHYSAYSSRESYYADYVSFILGIEQEDEVDKFNGFSFTTTFPGNCWSDRFTTLLSAVEVLQPQWGLDDKNAFTSWIDADYWLLGLIYHIVFEGKQLNDDIQPLCDSIKHAITQKKDPATGYPKTPNRLMNLRDRIQNSINLYATHVH